MSLNPPDVDYTQEQWDILAFPAIWISALPYGHFLSVTVAFTCRWGRGSLPIQFQSLSMRRRWPKVRLWSRPWRWRTVDWYEIADFSFGVPPCGRVPGLK